MATAQQKQDEDLASDTRSAMRAASERVRRDMSETKFLQSVAKLIIDYCGGMRGVDQMANLKVLASVRPGPDANLTNLNGSIRDAGVAALTDYSAKAAPDFNKPPTKEAVAEWCNDQEICPLLRNALSIGADERGLARVRAAIKRNEGN